MLKKNNKKHTIQQWQLEKVEYHQEWEECIEMNIKSIGPLNILSSWWVYYHVFICHNPEQISHMQTILLHSHNCFIPLYNTMGHCFK